MNTTQLECLYNFHDCDAIVPFVIENNDITVTFCLANHLQYNEFKLKHSALINNKNHHLVVKARFTQCTNIKTNQWFFKHSDKKRINEKPFDITQIDSEMLLYTFSATDKEGIYFLFTNDLDNKGCEISFMCESVEVVEEKFLGDEEFENL